MPKLFPVLIEIEQSQVGKVMLALNKMPGVAKIGLEMDRRKPKPNGEAVLRAPRPPAKQFGMKAEEFVSGLLFKDAMPTKVLKQHFSDVGRSPLSVNSHMTEMKDNGLVKSENGLWVLTKKGRDRIRHKITKGRK